MKRAVEAARTYSWNNVLDPNDPASEELLRTMVREVIKAIRPDIRSMNRARAVAKTVGLAPSEVDLAVCGWIDAILAEKP